ncbi:MAG: N4-gp56 family major capsid protein [Acidimicrobiales bacterium]
MAQTDTNSLSTVVEAYNLTADNALRPMLHFDQVATVKPSNQAHRGESVTFTIYDDLEPATDPLTEGSDVDAVEMSDTQVSVTLEEYGNATTTTAKLRGTGFLAYDQEAAELIGWNAGLSVDRLARAELAGGSNVRYSGSAGSRGAITDSDVLKSADSKYVAAKLRGAYVPGWNGMAYVGFIHPDVSYDYREDAGANNWDDAAIRNEGGQRVWNGLIGRHNGVDWIETGEAPILTDEGDTTTDVYQTIIVGRRCLAKAYSRNESAERPRVVPGPVTDKLRRFRHVGWYWLGGYKRYREAAIYRVESASSIGDN